MNGELYNMNTIIRLRLDFNNKIRPLYIKNQCEYCESTEQLELNHISKHFATMLHETLDMLGLKYYIEWNEYTDNEKELIRDIMLGKQLRCDYNTLCKECHVKYHDEYGKDWTKLNKYYYDKRIESENERRMYNNEVVIPYLNSIVDNVLLTKNDRTKLIEVLNVRNKINNRILKSIDILNSYLKENKFNYYIKEFETSRIIEGKKKKYKSAWKVVKIVE